MANLGLVVLIKVVDLYFNIKKNKKPCIKSSLETLYMTKIPTNVQRHLYCTI